MLYINKCSHLHPTTLMLWYEFVWNCHFHKCQDCPDISLWLQVMGSQVRTSIMHCCCSRPCKLSWGPGRLTERRGQPVGARRIQGNPTAVVYEAWPSPLRPSFWSLLWPPSTTVRANVASHYPRATTTPSWSTAWCRRGTGPVVRPAACQ